MFGSVELRTAVEREGRGALRGVGSLGIKRPTWGPTPHEDTDEREHQGRGTTASWHMYLVLGMAWEAAAAASDTTPGPSPQALGRRRKNKLEMRHIPTFHVPSPAAAPERASEQRARAVHGRLPKPRPRSQPQPRPRFPSRSSFPLPTARTAYLYRPCSAVSFGPRRTLLPNIEDLTLGITEYEYGPPALLSLRAGRCGVVATS